MVSNGDDHLVSGLVLVMLLSVVISSLDFAPPHLAVDRR
ncbi:MAG: hypothetical protein QOE58_3400 [Actinomycetota bacterium]|jgi:hypothetical protein|nr:hypothetical protein [Actinomycetota bacterium]